MPITDETIPADEVREGPRDSPGVVGARELLTLLVKTQKARRLYEGNNAVSERLETELFDRLSGFLEQQGELALAVHEFEIRCNGETVYESREQNASLAFFLYRDGIRRLSFHPGLEAEELRGFVSCLDRVALLANDQDDLVTLFWEQEFRAIRYFAIEELSESDPYPRLEDQLATGELDCDGATTARGVSLDLEQPVSAVPVEACRLTDEELDGLRDELSRDEATSFEHLVIELAIELTLLEEDAGERKEILRSLVAICDRLIEDGALAELVAMAEHLDGLAQMVFGKQATVQDLAHAFVDHLRSPDRLERFLTKVNEHGTPKPAALTAYLARLADGVPTDEGVVPVLVPWLGRLHSSAYRRAVTDVLKTLEDEGLGILEAHLPLGAPDEAPQEQLEHRQFVREILHGLARLPEEKALPLLTRMLGARDRETRLEAFLSLSRYSAEDLEELCLDHLTDRDPEIRAQALDTLVRRGGSELGGKLLERILPNGGLERYGLAEKRRIFAAAAKLSGDRILDTLARLLEGWEDRWFAAKKEKELAEAVAHGMRVVGTDKSQALLARLATSGARFVQKACERELGH